MSECIRHAETIKRIEQIEDDIRDLKNKDNDRGLQQATTDTKLDFIMGMIKDLQDNVKKLTEQPAKRWDNMINAGVACIVSMALSGMVTFVLTRH